METVNLRQFLPYNERVSNTINASIASAVSGRTSRSHAAAGNIVHRGFASGMKQDGTGRSLDAVRVNLQKFVNQELHAVLQRYVKEYFEPAIENIRTNIGPESVNEDHVKYLLCKMLDEAKKMYEPVTFTATSSASPYSNASDVDQVQEPFARYGVRRDSDGDSYSSGSSRKRPKTEKPKSKQRPVQKANGIARPLNPNVDAADITETTKFMLGSAANKVLGYSAARGRIYVKHPDLFKYVGDQEDKQWLFENKIMTAAGGKAFLVLAEEIRDIFRTDDPSVRRGSVSGAKEFTIPAFMLEKVRASASKYSGPGARSRSGSSVSNISRDSSAPTEPDNEPPEPEPSAEIQPTTPENPLQHYMDATDAHRGLYNNHDSGEFFSRLMHDSDVFNGENDVFASEDNEFLNGPTLDSINPTIGTFGHSHELGHLGHLDF